MPLISARSASIDADDSHRNISFFTTETFTPLVYQINTTVPGLDKRFLSNQNLSSILMLLFVPSLSKSRVLQKLKDLLGMFIFFVFKMLKQL